MKIILFLLGLLTAIQSQAQIFVVDSARFEVAWKMDKSVSKADLDKEQVLLQCFIATRASASQAILGKQEWKGGVLHFRSAVKPSPTVDIECFVKSGELADSIKFRVPGAVKQYKPPKILAIYPSVDTIPENTILFYAVFDQPMDENYFNHKEIQVVANKNEQRPLPWRHEVNWNQDRTIAALMIHPGRIKQGINYLDSLGPVFRSGEQSELVFGNGLRNTNAEYPEQKARKQYVIRKADTILPVLLENEIKLPQSQTKEALILPFNEAMCFGSILNGIKVLDSSMRQIQGEFSSSNKDRTWHFIPKENWQAGNITIVINQFPADLALNTLFQGFELNTEVETQTNAKRKEISFELK